PADHGFSLDRLLSLGLDGLLAPEQAASAPEGLAFGLDFLSQFLYGGQALGKALQQSRARTGPAGLLYSAFFPPHVRGAGKEMAEDRGWEDPEPAPLRERPSRPLAPYDREEGAFFPGRDDEVAVFPALLDRAGTRLLILHGASGVGKTSF